jgi:hypothetical protein
MGFEIYEERMVVRNGKVPDNAYAAHYALLSDHRGVLEVRNQGSEPETLTFEIKEPSEYGDVEVTRKSFDGAVAALRRLRGADAPASPEVENLRERAAVVVERSCEILETHGDTGATQAGQLRATMLQLIDLATSRGEATPELESANS